MTSLGGSRIVNINSEERSHGTHENGTYTITVSADESYSHCCVLQASIPVSYYLIPDGRNTFQVDLGDAKTPTTITVPPGNYTALAFSKVVTALLNELDSNYVWKITMNNSLTNVTDGKFKYSVTSPGGAPPPNDPSIIVSTHMYEQFGFNKNSTNLIVDELYSTNVVNFVPEQTLYLQSSLVETQKNNSDGLLQEVFASNAVAFSFVRYQCTTFEAYSKRMSNPKANSFSISLQNEAGDIMNLNGRNMTMTILLFNPNTTFDLIQSYLKFAINTLPDERTV